MSLDGNKTLTDVGPANPPGLGLRAGVGLGLVAAATVGAMEGFGVLVADTYPVTVGRGVALMASDAVGTGILVAVPLWVSGAVLRRIAGGFRPEAGALLGIYLAAMAGFTVDWFTGPAPHVVVTSSHGNLLVFFGVAAVGLGLTLGLARVLAGRHAFAVAAVAAVILFLHLGTHPDMRRLPEPMDPGGDRPNVVMVTIDTIRADHVGPYTQESPADTQSMNLLAVQGAMFKDAFAQIPVTGPSHLTLMSGIGPWEHGVLLNGMPVPRATQTLAERFQARGYRTGAFVSAFVLNGQSGFDRGFEVYDDDFGLVPGWQDTLAGRTFSALQRRFDPHLVLERRGEETMGRAVGWLESSDPRPVFLWVHLFDPHGPYDPPAPWGNYTGGENGPRDPNNHSMDRVTGVAAYMLPSLEGIRDLSWVLSRYAGEVSYADHQISGLMDWLERDGQADNTVLVVAGDHGESLGEHGVWFKHGGDLHDAEVRVPLFIRYPPSIPNGRWVTGPVELTDVAPTIAELTGLDTAGMDGVSLLAAIEQSRSVRRFARGLCYDRAANLAARASGDISHPTYTVASLRGEDSRFELRTAPGTVPRMWRGTGDEETPVADPLQDEDWPADAFTELMGATIGDGSSRDEATLEKLRALGYVQ